MTRYTLSTPIDLALGVPVCAGDNAVFVVTRYYPKRDAVRVSDGGALRDVDDMRVDISKHLGFAHALRWFALRNRGVGVRGTNWIDALASRLAFDDVSRRDVMDLDEAIEALAKHLASDAPRLFPPRSP